MKCLPCRLERECPGSSLSASRKHPGIARSVSRASWQRADGFLAATDGAKTCQDALPTVVFCDQPTNARLVGTHKLPRLVLPRKLRFS